MRDRLALRGLLLGEVVRLSSRNQRRPSKLTIVAHQRIATLVHAAKKRPFGIDAETAACRDNFALTLRCVEGKQVLTALRVVPAKLRRRRCTAAE